MLSEKKLFIEFCLWLWLTMVISLWGEIFPKHFKNEEIFPEPDKYNQSFFLKKTFRGLDKNCCCCCNIVVVVVNTKSMKQQQQQQSDEFLLLFLPWHSVFLLSFQISPPDYIDWIRSILGFFVVPNKNDRQKM